MRTLDNEMSLEDPHRDRIIRLHSCFQAFLFDGSGVTPNYENLASCFPESGILPSLAFCDPSASLPEVSVKPIPITTVMKLLDLSDALIFVMM